MHYDFRSAPITATAFAKGMKALAQVMKKASAESYDNAYAALATLDDYDSINKVGALARHFKDVDVLIVCGIGGSNLGTMAVAQACLGKDYRLRNTPTVHFADTVDADSTADIISAINRAIDGHKNIVINVVSKSGTTTETVALFTVLLGVIKRIEDYRDHIVITTDAGSSLWHLGRQEGYHLLGIPKNCGGRYSVFSAVGLFPLAVMGIDVQEFIKGAVHGRSYCLKKDNENPAALSAIALHAYLKKGRTIHDTFVFGHRLEALGKWYRQLSAESLGKERTTKGRKVNSGITPTVSVGSVDLHSVGQLYIDGPADKMTTFIDMEKAADIHVPLDKSLALLVDNVQGKTLKRIMDAILGGTKAAYANQKRPFIGITLPDCGEKAIGELMMMKMLETIYLGALLDVNPFDQPAVEKYKTETRRLLR